MLPENLLADIQPPICVILSREAFDGLDDEDHIRTDLDLVLDFAARFFANLGNYRSQGDTKFIPRIERDSFEQLSQYTHSTHSQYSLTVLTHRTHSKFLEVAEKLYATVPNRLGYPDDDDAASGYYPGSATITKELSITQHAMQDHNMLPENTRVLKDLVPTDTASPAEQYILLVASSLIPSPSPSSDEISLDLPGNPRLKIQRGDYSPAFGAVIDKLESAKTHTEEPLRNEMICQLIEAFSSGNHFKFKEAQKDLVRGVNPNVEVIIGIIETYQDPHGIRGEWEGIVAVLPWNGTNVGLPNNQKSAFEPVNFRKPDFTSLDRRGSGQLFIESEPGVYNFDINDPPLNPVTHGPISNWYRPDRTWSSVFRSHANAIEECRADGVVLILLTHELVLEIFGYTDISNNTAEDIMYAGWLYFVYGAVKGLISWNPKTRGQYALILCMMKADASFFEIERISDNLAIVMIERRF
ncbi:hypothetical protein G7Y89_g2947 [Cudoniella acicularis]|uniref:Uncharacterized protein n=1 Tax=Cudoniella acicularis TaxID=354080 RepID=A0A8H4RTK1_9HELO|nr:hypothetical protein G7Y89_g2947 [Cudoniella acicularis]